MAVPAGGLLGRSAASGAQSPPSSSSTEPACRTDLGQTRADHSMQQGQCMHTRLTPGLGVVPKLGSYSCHEQRVTVLDVVILPSSEHGNMQKCAHMPPAPRAGETAALQVKVVQLSNAAMHTVCRLESAATSNDHGVGSTIFMCHSGPAACDSLSTQLALPLLASSM